MNTLETLEIGIAAAAVLFGAAQIGMILVTKFLKEQVAAWKTKLTSSHSTLAKLELIIFY